MAKRTLGTKKSPEPAMQPHTPPPLEPKNETQAEYLQALRTATQVFVLGPAGTGKTWLAASVAADMLRDGTVERIIITRPNVPGGSGRSLGAFPGDRNEKMANWAAPVASRIKERLGVVAYDAALRRGAIEVVPFETMRGLSWEDCFVILDEAQNATTDDMKMFLTRVGQGSRVVVNGDISQCDLRKQQSGLAVALYLIERFGIDATVVEFGIEDIVRSGTCAQWVRAFHAAERETLDGYEGELLREVLDEWEPEGVAC